MNSLNILDRQRYFLVFIFFLAFWSSILMGSGSVFSGYHFVDDHEILRIHNELSTTQNSILGAIKDRMIDDFKLRFKPLHSIYRIMQISIFGANFTMLLAYAGILAVFTSFFLFLFFKKIGFSLSESILFPLLSFTGSQGAIWWPAGINEAISMFLLSLALIFMAYSIHSEKGGFIYKLLFVLFAILTSLSKESFILIIPALVFWMVWLYKEKNDISFFDSIKRNTLTIVILLLVMSVELFIIVKWIGAQGYGSHAGGVDGFKPLLYLRTAKDITLSISTINLGLVIILSILLIMFSNVGKGLYVKIKRFFGDFYYAIILMVIITFPQFVIYARSGVFGRYILPLILGYSIFLLHIIRFLRTNDTQYFIKLPDRGLKMLRLFCGILGLSLFMGGVMFLHNENIRQLLFSFSNRHVPRELADILKPGMLSVASGIFIISCGWIVAKRSAGRLAVLNIVISLTIASLVYKTMLTFAGAYEYAMHGKDANSLFKSVEMHAKHNDIILVVADPDVNYNEAGWSIKVYLNHVLKRGNVYVYPLFVNNVDKMEMDRMAVNYERMFEGKSLSSIENKSDIKYIIVFRELEQKFLDASKEWFDSSELVREASILFITYYKNI